MSRLSVTSPAILRRNRERISLVRLLEWSRFLSLLSLSICVAAFCGYVFGITSLLRPLENQAIHPVTALGAALVALAVLVSERRDRGSILLLRLLCSSVIVAMMARLLFEVASGSLYDRLVPDSLVTVLQPMPVVSGNSALCLLLLATSLLLRNLRDALVAQALAFLAFGLPALSLIGYLMGIGAFHGRMSLTTVLILIPLCASVMLSSVRSGFLRRLLGNGQISALARAYLLLIMLLPYLVGFALLQFSSTYAGLPLAMLTVATSQLVGLCICFFVLSSANIEVSSQAAMRLARSRSCRDRLTGALNRGHFADCAVRIIDQRRAAEDVLSLLFIDIDHFKRVNDTHGHAAGDAVLQRAYSLMRECLRNDDIIARWGGEEFVVLLPGVEIRGAERLAETLRRRVAQQAIRHDARELCITISVGCAQVERHESLDQLIARADKALYRAKDLGRNRIAVG